MNDDEHGPRSPVAMTSGSVSSNSARERGERAREEWGASKNGSASPSREERAGAHGKEVRAFCPAWTP